MGVRLRSGVIVLPWRSRASQAFGPDTTGGCPDAVLASRYRRQQPPPLAGLDVFLRQGLLHLGARSSRERRSGRVGSALAGAAGAVLRIRRNQTVAVGGRRVVTVA